MGSEIPIKIASWTCCISNMFNVAYLASRTKEKQRFLSTSCVCLKVTPAVTNFDLFLPKAVTW